MNSQTNRHYAKQNWMTPLSLIACAMLMGLVACSKGGDSNTAAPVYPTAYNPYINQQCVGCATNMGQGFLASALSRDQALGTMAEMSLSFFGDPQILAMTQGYPQGGYQQGYFMALPTGAYRGGFAASGYLFLPMGLPQCGIPAGRFQLQTQQPGIWGNDGAGRSGEGIRLMMMGGAAQAIITLSGFTVPTTPPAIGQDRQTYPYRFQTTTMVIQGSYGTCSLYMD